MFILIKFSFFRQVAAISLQRDQCNVNGTRRYIWKDNCVEKKFLETELSQLFPNYSNPNYNWSPQLPLSNAMSSIICDTSITYFITSPGLGPWDDYDCCNQPYPYQPSGTACRYGNVWDNGDVGFLNKIN